MRPAGEIHEANHKITNLQIYNLNDHEVSLTDKNGYLKNMKIA